MNTKNDVEVIINGKQYTLSGYESSEYLQKIANHINDKLTELKLNEGYMRLEAEMKNIYLAINLTDDYYKVQQSVEDLQKDKEGLEAEIFNIKHDMIEMKTQLEERQKEIEALQKDKTESEHKVIRLETELESVKAENSEMKEEKNNKIAVLESEGGQEDGAAGSGVQDVAVHTQEAESSSSGIDAENVGTSVENIEGVVNKKPADNKDNSEDSNGDIKNEDSGNSGGNTVSDENSSRNDANGNTYNGNNYNGGRNSKKNRRSGGKRR